MATCTIGPLATTGERCGKPAVFVAPTFAECALHHVALPVRTEGHAFVRRAYTRVTCAICGRHMTAKVHRA